jgi:hypothetical protein
MVRLAFAGQPPAGAGQDWLGATQSRGLAFTSHVSPRDWQLWHAAPPEPHAVSTKPASQTPAASQHPEQLDGPHAAGVTQELPAQTWPPVHGAHAAPPLPHAAFCVPVAHTPFSQQPEHVPGPHVGSQKPSTHCSFDVQVAQTLPRVPHTDWVVPFTHWPEPSQQPAGHVL